MRRVGLTGGIGAGKSTAAALLAEQGAVVVDADALAREVVAPGTPGLAQVAEAFPGVLGTDGSLDRAALAGRVFADPVARRRLEAITHPLIAAETERRVAALAADAVFVHDVPLLVELGLAPGYDLVIVVRAPLAERRRRLAARGLPADQIEARLASQADDRSRAAVADVLLDNAGDPGGLRRQVRQLWTGRLLPFARNAAAGRPAPRGTLRPGPPDPDLGRRAANLAARVRRVTGGRTVAHVGPGAVPELPATAVIELQVALASPAEAEPVAAALAGAGLPPARHPGAGGPPGGTGVGGPWLHRNADPGCPADIWLRPAGDPGWREALLLRDWLLAVPSARADYTAACTAAGGGGAGQGDPAAGQRWSVAALARAEQWAARCGWLPAG